MENILEGWENTRHKLSRAKAKKGELLTAGDKEVNRKGGLFLVGFGRAIDQDVLNCMSIVYRYWRGGWLGAYGDRENTS